LGPVKPLIRLWLICAAVGIAAVVALALACAALLDHTP